MSVLRQCTQFKATDGKWYMLLGNSEYAFEDWECTAYGPYDDIAGCDLELKNHSNPGCGEIDDSGTRPPPESPFKRKPFRTGFLYR